MISKTRKLVSNALADKKLEKLIYDMCKNISNKDKMEIGDVYNKLAYEKLGEIIENPDKLESIKKDLNEINIGWDSTVYEEYINIESKENSDHVEGIKVEKSAFKCNNRKCGSNETYYYQTQSRSADEGSTTHVVCSKCGSRYTFC